MPFIVRFLYLIVGGTKIYSIKVVILKMNFEEAEQKINSLLKFGVKPGLERIKIFLNEIGNPQDKLKFIHIAGTNGKGSTCTMIASVLKESGYKTGLFLSPYVVDFRERFQINCEMIGEVEFQGIVENLFESVESLSRKGVIITEFEFITALAFEWFYKKKCDIVVLETGLGGRYDATNVINKPEVSVITSVSMDHKKILGDTVEKIAVEKCGIIKENGITVVNPEEHKPSVLKIISNTSKILCNKLVLVDSDILKVVNKTNFKTIVRYKNIDIKLPFIGEYQVENAKTALCVLEVLSEKFNINEASLKNGIELSYIPARMEILNDKPLVILDGAHNLAAVNKLCKFINDNLKGKRVICIIGMMADKDACNMLKLISNYCDELVAVTVNNDRSMAAEEIYKIACNFSKNVKVYGKNLELAVKDYIISTSDDVVIICGSLYLASEIRPLLIKYLKGEF